MVPGEFLEAWGKDNIPQVEIQAPVPKNPFSVRQRTQYRTLIGQTDELAHIAGEAGVISRRRQGILHRRRIEGCQEVCRDDGHQKSAFSSIDKQVRQCKNRPLDIDRKPAACVARELSNDRGCVARHLAFAQDVQDLVRAQFARFQES
jgi:hypothetical protein